MSTAQEIENAIRSLSPAERDKLVQQIPELFPEFRGDSEWERIAHNERPRPALTDLLNRYDGDLDRDSDVFPKVAEGDFSRCAGVLATLSETVTRDSACCAQGPPAV